MESYSQFKSMSRLNDDEIFEEVQKRLKLVAIIVTNAVKRTGRK